jgi:biopolymer transport protein ExbD
MFYFLLKIMICILVVFGIHTIWQTVQDQCFRPRIKNTNAEIEKYKSLVETISQQQKQKQQNKSREEEKPIQIPALLEERDRNQNPIDIESDLNSFLDSILVENHIEIMPVV